MAWNYESTNIDSSGRSWVRFHIGDTTSGDQLLQDAEIDALLNSWPQQKAAAVAARGIAARYARKVDKQVGAIRLAMAQASQQYLKIAEELEYQMGLSAGIYAGGISRSDVLTEEDDSDRPKRLFEIDQFTHVGTLDGTTD